MILLIPFTRNVLNRFGSEYSRVDVMFDSYLETSHKAGARSNRSVRPIRRVIDSRIVPRSKLPKDCTDQQATKGLYREKATKGLYFSTSYQRIVLFNKLPKDCTEKQATTGLYFSTSYQRIVLRSKLQKDCTEKQATKGLY